MVVRRHFMIPAKSHPNAKNVRRWGLFHDPLERRLTVRDLTFSWPTYMFAKKKRCD